MTTLLLSMMVLFCTVGDFQLSAQEAQGSEEWYSLDRAFIHDYGFSYYFQRFNVIAPRLSGQKLKFYDRRVGITDTDFTSSNPLTIEKIYSRFGALRVTKQTWGTGYGLSKYCDGIFYSEEGFFVSSGGAGSYLTEDEITSSSIKGGYYRVSGPSVSDKAFRVAIDRKISDRKRYVRLFYEDSKDDGAIREAIKQILMTLRNGQYEDLLQMISSKYGLVYKHSGNSIDRVSHDNFISELDSGGTLFKAIDSYRFQILQNPMGDFGVYVNAFINEDINQYVKKFAGTTLIELKVPGLFTYVSLLLSKEAEEFRLARVDIYLTDGE